MDYLQYINAVLEHFFRYFSFKPYYKWITFNIASHTIEGTLTEWSFKPYYKWITFNIICVQNNPHGFESVLNLIINGLPSI